MDLVLDLVLVLLVGREGVLGILFVMVGGLCDCSVRRFLLGFLCLGYSGRGSCMRQGVTRQEAFVLGLRGSLPSTPFVAPILPARKTRLRYV